MAESRIIALGSSSPQKKEALQLALRQINIRKKVKARENSSSLLVVMENREEYNAQYTVRAFRTPSGQNEQPCGQEETFQGALQRAETAFKKCPKAYAAVGIESGIFKIDLDKPVTIDMAFIVILTHDGRRIVSTTPAVPLPEEFVLEAKKLGFKETTVGARIAKKLGGEADDPHQTVTQGKVFRVETLIAGLQIALDQL